MYSLQRKSVIGFKTTVANIAENISNIPGTKLIFSLLVCVFCQQYIWHWQESVIVYLLSVSLDMGYAGETKELLNQLNKQKELKANNEIV